MDKSINASNEQESKEPSPVDEKDSTSSTSKTSASKNKKGAESDKSSLVVIANRLPVDSREEPDGTITWHKSPGGLVTALEPILRQREGAWIGWAGGTSEPPEPFKEDGLKILPVKLDQTDIEHYYEGFSNSTLWPLYHDAIVTPTYDRAWWTRYKAVNKRFAEAAAKEAAEGGVVFVQDYQLQLVPQMLREMRPDLRIGFFLHIPFPPKELFAQLPWRKRILEGLLGADLVGFQVKGAASNFLDLTEAFLGLSTSEDSVTAEDGRTVQVGDYPISINSKEYDEVARSSEVEKLIHKNLSDIGEDKRILLGVDRLDYTKGIDRRLKAFREMLADGRIDPEKSVLIQVAPPSRERVESYAKLREEIEREVGSINGEFGSMSSPVVIYIPKSLNKKELAALFRIADIMMVTPIRDGMNLVCKEYVASRIHGDGNLVLSEFAGAAQELKEAWLCNPHDIDGLKEVIEKAWNADEKEQKRRMETMREQVFDYDVDRWASDILSSLGVN